MTIPLVLTGLFLVSGYAVIKATVPLRMPVFRLSHQFSLRTMLFATLGSCIGTLLASTNPALLMQCALALTVYALALCISRRRTAMSGAAILGVAAGYYLVPSKFGIAIGLLVFVLSEEILARWFRGFLNPSSVD